jgi:hypothetical protein
MGRNMPALRPYTQQPPSAQVLLAQQGAPSAPHFKHVGRPVFGLVRHSSPASLHLSPVEQHTSPCLPHSQIPVAQVPAADVAGTRQFEPSPTHLPDEQQPESMQAPFGQHGPPMSPHGRQVFTRVSQAIDGSSQRAPAQHGSLRPPQVRH